MARQVVILRGVPGAGKSTLAKKIISDAVARGEEAKAFSSDDYFTTAEGKYHFDSRMLPQAHASCFRHFLEYLQRSQGIAIVDNTNTLVFEMSPYILAGQAYSANVKIIRLTCDPTVAAARNVRCATSEMVEKMASRMESLPSLYPSEEVKVTG